MKFLKKPLLVFIVSVATICGVQADNINDGLTLLDKGDYKKAAEFFTKAYDKKQPDGGFYLGRMFELGIGTKVDIRRSASIYTAASKKGSHKAANRLAMLYIEGKGLLQDYKKAVGYLKGAAEGGNKDAQFNYAVMFEKGWGLKKDLTQSLKWYKKAAKQGHIAAQNTVGIMYLEGKGVKKSEVDALKWFDMSARKGNALGLFFLGKHFSEEAIRDSKKITLEKAYILFNLAAAGGHPSALKERNKISLKLSPEQINKAQESARKWLEMDVLKRTSFLK